MTTALLMLFIAGVGISKCCQNGFISQPHNLEVNLGESGTFNCSYSFTQDAPVWIISGKSYHVLAQLPPRYSRSAFSITISDVTAKDNGTRFQCLVNRNLSSIGILFIRDNSQNGSNPAVISTITEYLATVMTEATTTLQDIVPTTGMINHTLPKPQGDDNPGLVSVILGTTLAVLILILVVIGIGILIKKCYNIIKLIHNIKNDLL